MLDPLRAIDRCPHLLALQNLDFTGLSLNWSSAAPVIADSQGASQSKPVLGAALSIKSIPAHRDWLLERPRDLEIQDFFRADLLDSDWRSTAGEIKQMLSGHTGRLGIHGPFWGFKIDSHDPMSTRYHVGPGSAAHRRRDAALRPGDVREPAPGAGETCTRAIRALSGQVPVARVPSVRYPATKA